MAKYDPVTEDQWATIKAIALTKILKGYEMRGYSPDRIKTLMLQAELHLAENMASMRAESPNWLTPRRERILSEIR